MSEQVNKTLTTSEQIFYDVIWQPLFKAGNLALVAQVPELKLPVLSTIDALAVDALCSWTFGYVKEFVDVSYLKLKNVIAQSEFQKRSVELTVILHTKGANSDEYKNAREAAKIAMSKHTHIDV